MNDLCVLIPVWRDYRWLVPIMLDHLEKFWPEHPPVFLLGLTEEEAQGHPHFPVSDPARRGNWCWMVGDGVSQASAHFQRAYLIAEEHVPLQRCHGGHLNRTLPGLMDDLGAVYISLMGWDNRRYASRNPRLSWNRHRLMHLVRSHAPRFHLHPALWRLDALQRCCEISQRAEQKGGSAWHFEKTCEKPDADLPIEWKRGCYQIAAHALAEGEGWFRRMAVLLERWIFNRLLALVPWLPDPRWAERYLRLLAIDNVFCQGPYPMIFSGILQKGRLNENLSRRLGSTASGRHTLALITDAYSKNQSAGLAKVC